MRSEGRARRPVLGQATCGGPTQKMNRKRQTGARLGACVPQPRGRPWTCGPCAVWSEREAACTEAKATRSARPPAAPSLGRPAPLGSRAGHRPGPAGS